MSVNADFSQLQNLHKKFGALAAELSGGKLSDTMAHYLLQLCTNEVPVDTGRLQASHTIQENTPHRIRITADVYYARWVHDGHFNRLTGTFVPPNPWMTRALHQLQSIIVPQLMSELSMNLSVPPAPSTRVYMFRPSRLSRLFGKLRSHFG